MEEEEAPLVAENSETQTLTKKNHTRDMHILSSAFLLIFLALEEDIGTISLGILYLSFMVFSFFASLVVQFLGTKNALVLGTTGYWLFIAANLKPTCEFHETKSPCGLGLGRVRLDVVIWIAEGTYLTSTAHSHAHDLNLEEGNVIGNFNGEFWEMFAGHQGGTTSGTTLLYIVFLCSMTLGTILMCFLQKRDAKGEETLPDSSVSFYSSMVSMSKSVIAPLTKYTKYIVEPALGESGVGGAMAMYGAFDAIYSLAMGRLTSGLKSITLIVCARAFIQLFGVLGILYPLLIAAALEIGDRIFNTQLNVLLGKLFKHDMCVSIAVVFFVSPLISLHAMLVVMHVSVCIFVVGFLSLTLMVEKAFSCAD
ncbi:UNC93-like protein 3 [Camellia lanceoleosa]|uniref:UNC93-like protein 3 n=1 Tax=Camellia lanceoleosa TaxID=1840588 RepID=A0ACC0HT09_9ERIC|nr:UNC93-like protein 3 [Camellia lanceoleosa]